jgi:transcriptional regulator with XRE-family HTH domain
MPIDPIEGDRGKRVVASIGEIPLAQQDGTRIPGLEDIGKALRQLRKSQGLTLKQVAEACDCSVSYISQIELDKVFPSIVVLNRIARVLGVEVADLFSPPPHASNVVVKPDERIALTMPGWKAKIDLLVRNGENNRMQAFLIELEPGGNPGRYTHGGSKFTHPGEEFGYVLEGELELDLGDTKYHLSAGDSFYFSSRTTHCTFNPTKKLTRLIRVVSPPNF